MELFGCWNDNVTELIMATPEEDVLRRDIFDRPPIFKWVDGRVALLGDSAHAMQPNLGQGGCMAIEDAFQLSVDIRDGRLKREQAATVLEGLEKTAYYYPYMGVTLREVLGRIGVSLDEYQTLEDKFRAQA